jgi:hypothetical protein
VTIKTLRKSYENLSMLQRLSLADNAVARDDEIEALAIKAASPKIHYSQPDFIALFDQILRIRLCNLITRLGYILNFDLLLFAELEKLIDKSVSSKHERINDDLRLAGYLYVRATDSWNAINDELSLRPHFDEEIGGILFSIELLHAKDAIMREYAFSEDEARAYIQKLTGMSEIKTIEQEIQDYRDYLELK